MNILIVTLCAIIATSNARVIDSDNWSQDVERRPEPSNVLVGSSGRVVVDPLASNLEREPLPASSRNAPVSPIEKAITDRVGVVGSNQEARELLGEILNPSIAERLVSILEGGNNAGRLAAEIERDIPVPLAGRLIGNVGRLSQVDRDILSSPFVSGRLANGIPVSERLSNIAEIERDIAERSLAEIAALNGRIFSQVERNILLSPRVSERSVASSEWGVGPVSFAWNPLSRSFLSNNRISSGVNRRIVSQIVDEVSSLSRRVLVENAGRVASEIAAEVNAGLINGRSLSRLSPVERDILLSAVGSGRSGINNVQDVGVVREVASQIAGEVNSLSSRALVRNVERVASEIAAEVNAGLVNGRSLSGLSPVERDVLLSVVGSGRSGINNVPSAAVEREVALRIAGEVNLLSRRPLVESSVKIASEVADRVYSELVNGRGLSSLSPAERVILLSSVGSRSEVNNVPSARIEREIASQIAGQVNSLSRRALIEYVGTIASEVARGVYTVLENGRSLSELYPVGRDNLLFSVVSGNSGINGPSAEIAAQVNAELLNGRGFSGLSPVERDILLSSVRSGRSGVNNLPSAEIEREIASQIAQQVESVVPRRSLVDNGEWVSQRVQSFPYSQVEQDILTAPRRVGVSGQRGYQSGAWDDLPWARAGLWSRPAWNRSSWDRPVWRQSGVNRPVWRNVAQRELVGGQW